MTEVLIESGISPLVANILQGFVLLPLLLGALLVIVVVIKAAGRLPSRARYLISNRKDGVSSQPSSQLYNKVMTLFLQELALVSLWASLAAMAISMYITKGTN